MQTYLTMVIKVVGLTLWLCYILYHQSKLMHTKSAGIISLLNVKEYFHSECSEGVHCNKRDILQCLQFFHKHLLGSWICFCCKAYGRKVSYSTGLIRKLYESSDPGTHTFLSYSWWWNRASIKIFVCEKMQGDGHCPKYLIYLK